MMSDAALATSFLAGLHDRLQAVCDDTRAMTAGLNADQLNWRAAEGTWSIAECLEHTLIAADHYMEKMGPAIAGARGKTVSADGADQPKHTVAGRLIMWAVDPDIKFTMKAPKGFRPTARSYGGDVVTRFLASHEALAAMVQESDGLPLTKVKFGTPEASFIRINLADAFALLTMHAERHVNQARRVRDTAGFPR